MASAEYGIAALFVKRGAVRQNPLHFHGKTWIAALYKTAHFQEVQRTRGDKRSAQYAALISAAVARLLLIFYTSRTFT